MLPVHRGTSVQSATRIANKPPIWPASNTSPPVAVSVTVPEAASAETVTASSPFQGRSGPPGPDGGVSYGDGPDRELLLAAIAAVLAFTDCLVTDEGVGDLAPQATCFNRTDDPACAAVLQQLN